MYYRSRPVPSSSSSSSSGSSASKAAAPPRRGLLIHICVFLAASCQVEIKTRINREPSPSVRSTGVTAVVRQASVFAWDRSRVTPPLSRCLRLRSLRLRADAHVSFAAQRVCPGAGRRRAAVISQIRCCAGSVNSSRRQRQQQQRAASLSFGPDGLRVI